MLKKFTICTSLHFSLYKKKCLTTIKKKFFHKQRNKSKNNQLDFMKTEKV